MDNFTIKNKKVLLVGKTNSGKSQLQRYLLIKEKNTFQKNLVLTNSRDK